MIDTKKKIVLVDDRGKDDIRYPVFKILYEDDELCLGELYIAKVLFDKKTGEVLSKNFQFYYAENE
jgi:hypothetical protein